MRIGPAVVLGAVALASLLFAIYLAVAGETSRAAGTDAASRSGARVGVVLVATIFVAWPGLMLLGVVADMPWIALVALAAYIGTALLFGFSVGGPHLTFGVPPALAAVGWFLFMRRRARPRRVIST